MEQLFEILYEDADLLAINKPAGLVCHPTKTDEYSSLIGRIRLYLGPGARPHLVNRLDRETSGVTLAAKNVPTARELGRIWETRQVKKEYLALVHGLVRDDQGAIDAPLGKDERSRVAIKDCVRPDGAPARTDYSMISRQWPQGESQIRNLEFEPRPGSDVEAGEAWPAEFGLPPSPVSIRVPPPTTLLRVFPQTGRKHQIRIHLAHLGHPIVGDKLYGGEEDLYLALVENRLTCEQRQRLVLPYQALHAREVRFTWRGREVIFEAKLSLGCNWLSGHDFESRTINGIWE